GGVALREVHSATLVTSTLATITGQACIATPYDAHARAATPCTRRSVTGSLQKYEVMNSAVANQPIQSNVISPPIRPPAAAPRPSPGSSRGPSAPCPIPGAPVPGPRTGREC